MCVVVVSHECLQHLVTLLETQPVANLLVRQLIKEVVSHNPNQGIVSPRGEE